MGRWKNGTCLLRLGFPMAVFFLGVCGGRTPLDPAEVDSMPPMGGATFTGGVGHGEGGRGSDSMAADGGAKGLGGSSTSSGGAKGLGGSRGTGGLRGSGGSLASGGIRGTGGYPVSISTGGSRGGSFSGGAPGAGGVAHSGGAASTGGARSTGGLSGTGGARAGTGGVVACSAPGSTIESLFVSTNGNVFTSAQTYPSGTKFTITASGVVVWGGCDPKACPNGGACGYVRFGDARYITDDCWTTTESPFKGYPGLLYLSVNRLQPPPDWNPQGTTFSPQHTYEISLPPDTTGHYVFQYPDCTNCYGDNSGMLTVTIRCP